VFYYGFLFGMQGQQKCSWNLTVIGSPRKSVNFTSKIIYFQAKK